jgi:hypothetical protein
MSKALDDALAAIDKALAEADPEPEEDDDAELV